MTTSATVHEDHIIHRYTWCRKWSKN